MRPVLLLPLLLTLVPGSGCFTTGYLLQASAGQYELIHRARPLSHVAADETVPARVRSLLSLVPAIKRYGRLQGLKPTQNYQHYVQLNRSAAVWVVQGCQSLSFEPRRWQFPLIGSVPYLGFFDEGAARAYARELEKAERLDVTVRTAAAYSTLGWFKDAVLSTMIPEGPEAFGELANVILHESVHATVYVPSQSAFNESLASFVADELTWQLVVGRSGLRSEEARAWMAAQDRRARSLKELRAAYEDLDTLYRSGKSEEDKRAQKEARLTALQQVLGLRRRFNNADLAGSRTYDTGRPSFERLRRACGNWDAFFSAIRSLEPHHFASPQQQSFEEVVDQLTARACPSNLRGRSDASTPGGRE